jgi:acetyltransferase-like isoleucine patch superfamily enzyme
LKQRNALSTAVARLFRRRYWTGLLRSANFFAHDGLELDQASIGPGVRLSPTVSVRNGSRLSIAAGANIGQWCYLWAGDIAGKIDIGEHALLAPGVFVTASNYDFDAGLGPVADLPKKEADVRIGANTWLGARVVVLPGVTIGDGTVVAAGAIVAHDLPPGVLAAGVPARVIRARGGRN